MKSCLLACLILIGLQVNAQNSMDFFDKADSFFQKYCKGGVVDYFGAKQDADLILLMGMLENNAIPEGKEKAYLINAYNLFVINKIVQGYPMKSPMDDAGFFTEKTAVLAGNKISLNHLENNVLRKEFSDPRMHFVLVCGAKGCPPIVGFSYRPDQLEEQLERQTTLALNNPAFIYQQGGESTIYLSQIFDWYGEDFGKNSAQVVNYINSYRTNKFNTEYKVKYYDYDWSLNQAPMMIDKLPPNSTPETKPTETTNLQTFTAGSLLGQGKMDFTLFNTIYTETQGDWNGMRNSGYRSTFVTHLFQYTIGVTKNKRFNIGLDINFKSSATSSDPLFRSVGNAFAYKNNDSTRVGITSVGLRLKFQPFKAVQDFSIQSTVLAPTIKHPEGFSDGDPNTQNLYWADWNRITWWNQIFYSKMFARNKLQLFAELDFLFRFGVNDQQIGMLDLPASLFISYFPTKKLTIYAMTQHVSRLTNNHYFFDSSNPQPPTDWVVPMNYTASGIGVKYQLLSNLNLEFLYTNFWRGRNTGLGETFNLGIKFLTK